jgi:hypothetical protein
LLGCEDSFAAPFFFFQIASIAFQDFV